MKLSPRAKDILEWVYCIVIAIILALLVRYYVGTPTIVKQYSMYPTLKPNERLILNRLPRTFNQMPERGDIITFEAPKTDPELSEIDINSPKAVYPNNPTSFWSKFTHYVLEIGKTSYIKRVIALPGEHVELKEGKVFINGEELEENYLGDDVVTTPDLFSDFVVPEGCIFAMGDNRTRSTDCRAFGCIPLEKIEGKVVLRFWPFDVFGTVK